MAKWVCFQNRRGNLSLVHRDQKHTHNCGEIRNDTPLTMVLEWVVDQAACQPGDVLLLPDKTCLSFLNPCSES